MKEIIKEFVEGFKGLTKDLGIELSDKTNGNYSSNKMRFEIGEYITKFVIDKIKLGDIDNFLKDASNKLTKTNKDSGLSHTNLNYFRKFYKKYRNQPDLAEKAFELSWSKNIALLKDKLNDDERNYYLNRAIADDWSVKDIERQIQDDSFDNFLNEIEQNNYQFNIKALRIRNYKSLENINISNPSMLLVFAGANASGKSNIFEAIEFLMHAAMTTGTIAFDIFGGVENVVNFKASKQNGQILEIILDLSFGSNNHNIRFGLKYDIQSKQLTREFTGIKKLDEKIVNSFSRIFIDNYKKAENKLKIYNKLWIDASNLSSILKVILEDKKKKAEIIEWIQILIPEIESVSVEKDFSGKEELIVIEKSYPDKPFAGNLISEGTHNIIALLTLFYQTNQPQFVCIEEPETGLNPAVLSELIPFLREMTEKYHHHIWITTHSASLVAELSENELIIVNKKKGATQTNQCKEGDFEKMRPDEAWMSNMLKGGGLPW
jgi:predicted ATPase